MQEQNNLIRQKADLTNKIISNVKNLAKAESDFYESEGLAGETMKKINALLASTNGLREDNVKQLIVSQKELSKVHNEMKMLEKQQKSGSVTLDAYIEKRTQMIMKEQELKQTISGLQITMKNQVKIDQSIQDTMEQESLVLANLRMAWRALSDEKKNTEAGKQILATINELDQKLKENDATIGNHQRKVGNYEIAAKTLNVELLNVKQSLMEMALNGERGSEAYQKLEEKAVSLRTTIIDTNKAVTNLATHGTSMKAVTEGVSLVVSAYNAYKSAMVALGIENENLEKTMKRVMAAMAALQALEQINNVLLKESAFNTKIVGGLKQWWAGVLKKATAEQVANNASTASGTVAQAANAVATTAQAGAATAGAVANKGLAASFRLVGIAIKSIPVFGWIIAGIAGLVAVFKLLNRETREEREEMEKLKKTQESFDAQTKESSQTLSNQLTTLKSLQREWNGLGDSMQEKERFIKENKESFEKLGISVANVTDAENILVGNTEAFIKALQLKARALAGQNMATKEYERALVAQANAERKATEIKKKEEETPIVSFWDRFLSGVLANEGASVSAQNLAEDRKKEAIKKMTEEMERFKKESKAGFEEGDKYIDSSIAGMEEYNNLLKQIGVTQSKNAEKETKNKNKSNSGITDAQKLVIQGMQEEAEGLRELSEDTSKNYEERRAAAEQYASVLENISYMQTKYEIENQKLAGDAAKVAWGDSAREIRKINKDLNKNLAALDKEREKEERDALQKRIDDTKEAMNKSLNDIREAMNNELVEKSHAYEKEMLKYVGNESKRKQITTQYNQERLEIIRKYNQEAFEKEVAVLNELLENTELSEEAKTDIKKRIGVLTLKNSQDIADKEIQVTKNKVASQTSIEEEFQNFMNDKKTKAVMNMWEQSLDIANSYYDNQLQRMEEVFNRENELDDERLSRLQENLDNGLLSQENVDRQRAIIEAGQREREKKYEEERKRIQQKQAAWQKANDIIQATTGTAVAVVGALGNKPWTPFNIVLASIVGALGAVQIATIAAQKIPAYKEGTEGANHPGGLAIVGDGGRSEMAILPGGKIWETPARPVIANLPKGTEVLPDFKAACMNMAIMWPKVGEFSQSRQTPETYDDGQILAMLQSGNRKWDEIILQLKYIRGNSKYSENKMSISKLHDRWK
jgi:hypothetical protein